MSKTYSAKAVDVKRKWYVVDASEHVLGRLAARVATVLTGKHRPTFTPHVDTGDFVIVINAGKINVTGNKVQQKYYDRYTGFQGGRHIRTFEQMRDKRPARMVELAVKGMLPKNRLGRDMFRKLKVYAGAEHPHSAQRPEPLPF